MMEVASPRPILGGAVAPLTSLQVVEVASPLPSRVVVVGGMCPHDLIKMWLWHAPDLQEVEI